MDGEGSRLHNLGAGAGWAEDAFLQEDAILDQTADGTIPGDAMHGFGAVDLVTRDDSISFADEGEQLAFDRIITIGGRVEQG